MIEEKKRLAVLYYSTLHMDFCQFSFPALTCANSQGLHYIIFSTISC